MRYSTSMSYPLSRSQDCGRQRVYWKSAENKVEIAQTTSTTAQGTLAPDYRQPLHNTRNCCLLTGQQFKDILHNESYTLSCHKCSTVFDNVPQLNEHLLNCTDIVCRKCFFKFSKTAYKVHEQTCSIYCCNKCPKRFISADTLRIHQLSKHDVVKCEFCFNSFVSDIECETHKTQTHFFQCLVCNKEFGSSINAMRHRFSKSNEKLLCSLCYEASQCPRQQIIAEQDPLEINTTVSSWTKVKIENLDNETGYLNNDSAGLMSKNDSYKVVNSSNSANKSFVDKNISSQERVSVEEKVQYVCFYCDHNFDSFNRLKNHLKDLHNTELQEVPAEFEDKSYNALNKYESKIDELFGSSISLIDFENQSQYTCVICDKVYKSLGTYTKHVYDAHKIDSFLSTNNKYHCHECRVERFKLKDLNNHLYARHENFIHCDYCEQVLNSKKEVKVHILANHPDQPAFTCIDCSLKFYTHEELKKHCSWHWFQENLECPICNKKIKGKKKYKVHMHYHKIRISESGMDFTCPECGKVLSSKSSLLSHIRFVHRGGKNETILCGECGILVNARKYNRHHERVHSKGRIYRCNRCSRAFFSKELLRQHSDTHVEGRPYECEQCPAAFKQLRNLRMHSRNYHSEPSTTCKLCDLEFETSAALTEHRHLKHRRQLKFVKLESEEGFQCTVCPKILKTSRAVASHTRIAHETHLHSKCEVCSQRFPFSRQLMTHMATHTDPKPSLVCSFCHRNFTTLGSLNSHIKWVHIGERNFPCSYCSARFKRKDAQIVHERTHTDERPYGCGICQRRFRQRTDCKRHEAKHNMPGFRYNKPHRPRSRAAFPAFPTTPAAPSAEVVIEEVVEGPTSHLAPAPDSSDTLMLLPMPTHEDQQAAAYLSYIVQN